ncbi:MAG: hypothetical protein ABIZ71_00645, partial [Gemmatimonadales bacterium]
MTRFTRSNPRTDSPRWLAVVVVLLAAFVLAACAQSAGVAPEPPGRDEGGIPVDLGGNPGPDGFTDGSSNGGGQVPDISGRKIVKTG